MIGMWALGFATALALDATLFDGYPIWLGAPMLAALAAMTAITKQRDRARRNHKATPAPTPAATEATERPHCPCNGVHFPGADNCRWCKCHRTPVPAATDTPGQ